MTATATQTKAIADRLTELCKQGENRNAVEELYADDIVSVEACEMPGDPTGRETKGKQDVLGKNDWWYENHEVHGGSVDGPFMHGEDRFALTFNFDVTNKQSGNRMTMNEVAVYTVANDKIVREEFYYTF